MRISVYWTLEDNMVNDLFFCATLTVRRGGHTPSVQAEAEIWETGAEAVLPDTRFSWKRLTTSVIYCTESLTSQTSKKWSSQTRKKWVWEDFCKLMNSFVVGKTMENIRKWVNIRLVSSEKSLMKLKAKPNFDNLKIFNENMVGVHMKKAEIFFNKPVISGCQSLIFRKPWWMIVITSTSRKNTGRRHSCLWLILIISCMKSKLKISTKTYHKKLKASLI